MTPIPKDLLDAYHEARETLFRDMRHPSGAQLTERHIAALTALAEAYLDRVEYGRTTYDTAAKLADLWERRK